MDSQANKLPIIQTFIEAIKLPFKHIKTLLLFAMPLLLIQTFFIFSWSEILISAESEQALQPEITGRQILEFFIYLLILVMTIISCHRIFLLDNETVSKMRVLRWGMRELRYVGWVILVVLMIFLLQFVLGVVLYIIGVKTENSLSLIGVVVSLLVMYITSRLSLLFPATAVDKEENNIEYVWRISEGNSLRLMFLVGLLPLVFNTLLAYIPLTTNPISLILVSVIWLIIGAIELCLLSLSYDFLSKLPQEDELSVLNEKVEA